MTQKVNGTTFPGESLTGNMDFFTVRTTVDIRATGSLADSSQKNLDKLVETISLRAQPTLMSGVSVSSETAPIADLPGAGSTGSVNVYTFKFAIEHTQAWGTDGEDLELSLDGISGFKFSVGDTSDNNVAVVRNEFL